MQTGKVKFFNDTKGFGFITPSNGEKDVFVHVSGLDSGYSSLQQDEEVEFEVSEGKKGPQATQVRPLN